MLLKKEIIHSWLIHIKVFSYGRDDNGNHIYKNAVGFERILEIIRRIRNIVNHYEPIFPFLVLEMKQHKKIENS